MRWPRLSSRFRFSSCTARSTGCAFGRKLTETTRPRCRFTKFWTTNTVSGTAEENSTDEQRARHATEIGKVFADASPKELRSLETILKKIGRRGGSLRTGMKLRS